MPQIIVRTLAATTLLASLLFASTAKAGSPPPPPWNPTNQYRISFAYNPELMMRSHGGALFVCPNGFKYRCLTTKQHAQELVDYLNAPLRASGANVKAVVAGASVLKTNVRHAAGIDQQWSAMKALREKHGAHLLMVVNRTRHPWGVRGETFGAGSDLGWFTAGFANQEEHIFAHEVGHALGASHDPNDNYTPSQRPLAPYAVGWNSSSHTTLMKLAPRTMLDRFSDHEQWYGAPDRSVARWLRERYGRYGR